MSDWRYRQPEHDPGGAQQSDLVQGLTDSGLQIKAAEVI
jgi:hypothetical protein